MNNYKSSGYIDVCIITRNSMYPILPQSLRSIYKQVPINRLIVVDGFSRDGTVEYIKNFCRKYDVNCLIEFDKGNRATARQKAIENVETELFAFVDTDVILLENWYRNMVKYFDDPSVGMVWGLAVMDKKYNPDAWDIYRSQLRLLHLDEVDGLVREAMRGYTHDVLIRRDAVDGIRIPSDLHVLEDYYIKKYVESRGYRYVVARNAFTFHKFKGGIGGSRLMGKLGRKYGFYNSRNIIKKAFTAPFLSFLIAIYTNNLHAALYKFKVDYLTVAGFIFR